MCIIIPRREWKRKEKEGDTSDKSYDYMKKWRKENVYKINNS